MTHKNLSADLLKNGGEHGRCEVYIENDTGYAEENPETVTGVNFPLVDTGGVINPAIK